VPTFRDESPSPTNLPLVGRKEEILRLTEQLVSVEAGKGARVALISGEAGIGKTRLATEFLNIAKEHGFKVLSGKCLQGSIVPYLPIFEAFREADLSHLISFEMPPKVEYVLLMNPAGILVEQVGREKTSMDMSIFLGMVSAISSFMEETMRKLTGKRPDEATLNVMAHGSYRILLESRPTCSLVLILTGYETEFLKDEMSHTLDEIERVHGQLLREWDGDISKVTPIRAMLEPILKKYDGIDYVADPKNKQWRLFENISRGLRRITIEQPIALLLDGLQWSDGSSMSLLHAIIESCASDRILLLGTYRPENLESPDEKENRIVTLRRDLEREGTLSVIELGRLEEQDTENLLSCVLGDLAQGPLGKLIVKESEGSPFFALELATFLKAKGVVTLKDDHWRLEETIERIGLPGKVRDLVNARMDQLSRDQRSILECASVVGEVFKSDTIGCVLGTNKLDLLRALRDIEGRHRLITEVPDQRKYKFTHAKIREVLYSELPDELRMEFHRMIADCMRKSLGEGMEGILPEIAVHSYLAGSPDAASLCLKAGEVARSEFNNNEARRFFNMALERCREEERLKVLTTLGDLELQAGSLKDAETRFLDALKIARDIDEKAEVSCSLAKVLDRQGNVQKAMEYLDAVPIQRRSTMAYANWLTMRGFINYRFSRYGEAKALSEEALEILDKINGPVDSNADALITLALSCKELGDMDKAVDSFNRGLDITEKNKVWDRFIRTAFNLSVIDMWLGHFKKSLDLCKKATDIAERTGSRFLYVTLQYGIGMSLYYLGDWGRGESVLDKALKMAREFGTSFLMAGILSYRAFCRHELGRMEDAVEDSREALRITGPIEGDIRTITQQNSWELLVECGKVDDAALLGKGALEYIEPGSTKEQYYLLQRDLAKTLTLQGKRGEAENIFVMIEREGRERISVFDFSKALRWWGEALLDWGEEDRAREKLGKARVNFREMGAMGEFAKVEKILQAIESRRN